MLSQKPNQASQNTVHEHLYLDWVPGVSVHRDEQHGERVELPYDLPNEPITLQEMKEALTNLKVQRGDEISHEMLAYAAKAGFLQFMTPHAYSATEEQIRELSASAKQQDEHVATRDLALSDLSSTQSELEGLAQKELPGKWWQFWHKGELTQTQTEQKATLLENQEIQVQALEGSELLVNQSIQDGQRATALRNTLREYSPIDHGYVKLSLKGEQELQRINASEDQISVLGEEIESLSARQAYLEVEIATKKQYFSSWRSSPWVSRRSTRARKSEELQALEQEERSTVDAISEAQRTREELQVFDGKPARLRGNLDEQIELVAETDTPQLDEPTAPLMYPDEEPTSAPKPDYPAASPSPSPDPHPEFEPLPRGCPLDGELPYQRSTDNETSDEPLGVHELQEEARVSTSSEEIRDRTSELLTTLVEEQDYSGATALLRSPTILSHFRDESAALVATLSICLHEVVESDFENASTLLHEISDLLEDRLQVVVSDACHHLIENNHREDAASLLEQQGRRLPVDTLEQLGLEIITSQLEHGETEEAKSTLRKLSEISYSSALLEHCLDPVLTALCVDDAEDASDFLTEFSEQLGDEYSHVAAAAAQKLIGEEQFEATSQFLIGQRQNLTKQQLSSLSSDLIAACLENNNIDQSTSALENLAPHFSFFPEEFAALTDLHMQYLVDNDADALNAFFETFHETLGSAGAERIVNAALLIIDNQHFAAASALLQGQHTHLSIEQAEHVSRNLIAALVEQEDLSAARDVIDEVYSRFDFYPEKFAGVISPYIASLAVDDSSAADNFFDTYSQELGKDRRPQLIARTIQEALEREDFQCASTLLGGQYRQLSIEQTENLAISLVSNFVDQEDLSSAREVIDEVYSKFEYWPQQFANVVRPYLKQLAAEDPENADSFFDTYATELGNQELPVLITDAISQALNDEELHTAQVLLKGQYSRLSVEKVEDLATRLVSDLVAQEDLSSAREVIDEVYSKFEYYQPQFANVVRPYVKQLAAEDSASADSFFDSYATELGNKELPVLITDTITQALDDEELQTAQVLLRGQYNRLSTESVETLGLGLVTALVNEEDLSNAREVIDGIYGKFEYYQPQFANVVRPYLRATMDSDASAADSFLSDYKVELGKSHPTLVLEEVDRAMQDEAYVDASTLLRGQYGSIDLETLATVSTRLVSALVEDGDAEEASSLIEEISHRFEYMKPQYAALITPYLRHLSKSDIHSAVTFLSTHRGELGSSIQPLLIEEIDDSLEADAATDAAMLISEFFTDLSLDDLKRLSSQTVIKLCNEDELEPASEVITAISDRFGSDPNGFADLTEPYVSKLANDDTAAASAFLSEHSDSFGNTLQLVVIREVTRALEDEALDDATLLLRDHSDSLGVDDRIRLSQALSQSLNNTGDTDGAREILEEFS